jgi:hypothetical protein
LLKFNVQKKIIKKKSERKGKTRKGKQRKAKKGKEKERKERTGKKGKKKESEFFFAGEHIGPCEVPLNSHLAISSACHRGSVRLSVWLSQ